MDELEIQTQICKDVENVSFKSCNRGIPVPFSEGGRTTTCIVVTSAASQIGLLHSPNVLLFSNTFPAFINLTSFTVLGPFSFSGQMIVHLYMPRNMQKITIIKKVKYTGQGMQRVKQMSKMMVMASTKLHNSSIFKQLISQTDENQSSAILISNHCRTNKMCAYLSIFLYLMLNE